MKPLLFVSALLLVTPFRGAAPIQDYRLPNGLRLILSENHERPIVRLELRTAIEPLERQSGKEGLVGYLHEVLDGSGAGNYTQEAFRTYLENRALRFSHTLHASSLGWSVASDTQSQEAAFEALALAATRPRLESPHIEMWRQQFVRSYKKQSPRQQAEDQFLRATGDPDRSYLPTATSIHRIESGDLDFELRRLVRPERSVLVIQGDLNLAQAKQLALLHLGAWGPGPVSPAAPVEDTKPGRPRLTRTWIVREAGSAAEIQVGGGVLAPGKMHASLRATLERLIRKELGDLPTGGMVRMSLEVREGGTWLLQAKMRDNRNAVEGVKAFQGLFARLRGKRLTEADFSEARRRWQIDRINRSLHPQQDVAYLAETALLNPQLDDPMDRVKAEDLERWLQGMFDPKGVYYLITGEVREDGQQLEKLGLAPVSVIN